MVWLTKAAPAYASVIKQDLHLLLCNVQGLVKRFFNEKEVTSTLVMDALFSGCKQVEEATRGTAASKVSLFACCTT